MILLKTHKIIFSKKSKIPVLIFALLLYSPVIQSQECDCESSFQWLKETFEKNDAGFASAVQKKGKKAYEEHNSSTFIKVQSSTSDANCASILNEWTKFFRKGHVGVLFKGVNAKDNSSREALIEKYKKYPKYDINLDEFKSYLSEEHKSPLEGIWESRGYKLGIIKNGDNSKEYIGFVIEADGVYWHPNQIKLILKEKSKNLFTVDYYMRDHSLLKFKGNLINDSYLDTEINIWKKTSIKKPKENNAYVEAYLDFFYSDKPTFKTISSQTAYLSIPSFRISHKKILDSILSSNKEVLDKTENLILDLRFNDGGSDATYSELMKYLYTNPIRTIGTEFLSTELNNSRMLKMINNPDYPNKTKEWARNGLKKLESNLGEFVNLKEENVSIKTLDEVKKFPKNVAVLINNRIGSSGEQFLLAAKQSKKTKFFGTTTMGILDISNMYEIPFPCSNGKMYLGYCLSKSLRIPDFPIDEVGIQPDYYLDDSIPNSEWIKFSENIISNKTNN